MFQYRQKNMSTYRWYSFLYWAVQALAAPRFSGFFLMTETHTMKSPVRLAMGAWTIRRQGSSVSRLCSTTKVCGHLKLLTDNIAED